MLRLKPRNVMPAFALICLTLSLGGTVFCQSSAPADDPLLKECEACADERKVLRIEVAGLREQLRMKDEMIALQSKSLAEKNEIIGFWKEAATARKEAITIDSRIEAIQTTQLMECKQEVVRLRNPGFFRQLLSPQTVSGFALGYGARSIQGR